MKLPEGTSGFFLRTGDPQVAIAPPTEVSVTLGTTYGDIMIDLDINAAPRCALTFMTCVEEGWYENASFHRVAMAQDVSSRFISVAAAGGQSCGSCIAAYELPMARIRHQTGTVSLASRQPGTGTAEHFFICIGDEAARDCDERGKMVALGFAPFGMVVHGMDVVERIYQASPSPDGYVLSCQRENVSPSAAKIHRTRIEERWRS